VALPLVLDELVKQGYTFLAWDGKDFVATRGGSGEAALAAGAPIAQAPLYRQSHAVIIGINSYVSWPKLAYAVGDAQVVRDLLIRKFGFAPERIKTLLDGEATRKAILAALGDDLADPKKVAKEDACSCSSPGTAPPARCRAASTRATSSRWTLTPRTSRAKPFP